MRDTVENANALAHVMIFLWGPLIALFYATMRPTIATLWSIVGAALILPEQVAYDLPMIPELTKRTIPYYATFLVLVFKYRGRLMAARPLRGVDGLFLIMVIGIVGTTMTNTDPTGFGPVGATGLGPYDIVFEFFDNLVRVYLPFLVGRTMFTNERDLRDFLRFMVIAALFNALPALWETVMSPQIHRIVYGFRCVDFLQAIRMGGYRPSVMFSHGLSYARFFVIALIAAVALARARQRVAKLPPALAIWILIVVVIAARSTGAWVLSALAAPIAMFGSVKLQRRFCVGCAAIVIGYPLLFATGTFPAEELIDFGYSISEERGMSLEDRFEQELLLTDKVSSRPVFGWGAYSRSHEFDPVTREDITVIDGEWLVIFSERGAFGFFAWFGMYLCPLWVLFRRWDELPGGAARPLFGSACIAIAVMSVEMIFNAGGANPQFFFSGVLYGTLTGAIARARVQRARALLARREAAELAP